MEILDLVTLFPFIVLLKGCDFNRKNTIFDCENTLSSTIQVDGMAKNHAFGQINSKNAYGESIQNLLFWKRSEQDHTNTQSSFIASKI